MWLEQLSQSRGDHNTFGKASLRLVSSASFGCAGVLIGNKIDKENYRVVSTQEGKQLAASRKMAFFECSAVSREVLHSMAHCTSVSFALQKDNKGIAEIFKHLGNEFVTRYRSRIRMLERRGREQH